MRLYIVMSKWMEGAALIGIFTSFDLAQKAVQKWIERQNDIWEIDNDPHGVVGGHYSNKTQCGKWSITIKEFEDDFNQLTIE